jgi:hypothetical protein
MAYAHGYSLNRTEAGQMVIVVLLLALGVALYPICDTYRNRGKRL